MKRQRLTQTNRKTAGSGLYGSTKSVDRTIQANIRKIQRKAGKLARSLYAKDPKSSEFLAKHAKRSKSHTANILVQAMKDLGPKFASDGKEASYSVYGFPQKTVSRCLGACAELKAFAGSVASTLHQRKFDKFDAISSYLKSHKKETQCPCASLILQCYPSKDLRLASTVKEDLRESLVKMAWKDPKLRKRLSSLLDLDEGWLYWSDWD